MPTKLFGGVKTGATSVSLDALLQKVSDGAPDTGRVAANLTASYRRQGAARVAVTLADLAALTTPFTSADATHGSVKEDADGLYRVDWPDAAWAVGADYVTLELKDGTTSYYFERVALEPAGPGDVFSLIGAAGSGLTGIGDARMANLDAAVSVVVAALAAFAGLFVSATVSMVSSATSVVVAFSGPAPSPASLVGLYCCVTNATRAPEKLAVLTATAVDSNHVALTFATPGFASQPQVNDTVLIG